MSTWEKGWKEWVCGLIVKGHAFFDGRKLQTKLFRPLIVLPFEFYFNFGGCFGN